MLTTPMPLHSVCRATFRFLFLLRPSFTFASALCVAPADIWFSPKVISFANARGSWPRDAKTLAADPAAIEAALARVFASEDPNDPNEPDDKREITDDQREITDDKREITDKRETIANLHVSHVRSLLRARRAELAPLLCARRRADAFAAAVCVPLLRLALLALLALPSAALFRWVFVVFDWNFVEPMTYFLGYSAVWAAALFHYGSAGREEFSWEAIEAAAVQRMRSALYRRNGIDAEKVERMEREAREWEKFLEKY